MHEVCAQAGIRVRRQAQACAETCGAMGGQCTKQTLGSLSMLNKSTHVKNSISHELRRDLVILYIWSTSVKNRSNRLLLGWWLRNLGSELLKLEEVNLLNLVGL